MWRLSFTRFFGGENLKKLSSAYITNHYSTALLFSRAWHYQFNGVFNAETEKRLSDALLHNPSQLIPTIRDSMYHSRRRILHFRNCVTYVTIILQSGICSSTISPADASSVIEKLLRECIMYSQDDIAHLLFRAAVRFDKFGPVVRPSFLKLLYHAFKDSENCQQIFISIGEEMSKMEKKDVLSTCAFVLGGKKCCKVDHFTFENLTSDEITLLIECFGLKKESKQILFLLEKAFLPKATPETNGEIDKYFSAAASVLKDSPKELAVVLKLGVKHRVSFSDAACSVIMDNQIKLCATIEEVEAASDHVRNTYFLKEPSPLTECVCISKCTNVILSSSKKESTIFVLQNVEKLKVHFEKMKSVNYEFVDTRIALSILRGYGVSGKVNKMGAFFEKLDVSLFPEKHKLYDEALRWYSAGGFVKEVIDLKEEMMEKHIYHTVHTYQYVLRVIAGQLPELVHKYYREMRSKGIRLDGHITPLLIRLFSQSNALEQADALYLESRSKALKGNARSFSPRLVVEMLRIYHSNMDRCKEIIEDSHRLNLITNDMVQAECLDFFLANHLEEEANRFLSRLPEKSSSLYRILIKKAGKSNRKKFDMVLKMVNTDNVLWDERLLGAIISALAWFGDKEGVRKYVALGKKKNITVSSTFYCDTANSFSRVGLLEESETCWKELSESNLVISMVVFQRFLDLFLQQHNIVKVQEVLDTMMRLLPPNPTTATTVIDTLGKMGRLDEMEAVLNSMTTSMNAPPTFSTLLTVMRAYAKVGNIAKMEAMRQRIIKEGFSENRMVYNILFEGYGRAKRFERIEEVMSEQKKNGVDIDEVGYLLLLKIFSHEKMVQSIERLVNQIIASGIQFSSKLLAYIAGSFASVKNTLELERYVKMLLCHPDCSFRDVEKVYMMYASLRDTSKLQEMLDNPQLPKTKLVYNSCVAAFAKAGQYEKVAFLLSEMERKKFVLSRSTSILLSSLLVKAGQSELAQKILNTEEISESGTDHAFDAKLEADESNVLLQSAEHEEL